MLVGVRLKKSLARLANVPCKVCKELSTVYAKIAGATRQCKIYASLFLSSSRPHALFRESLLIYVDVF